MLFQKVRRYSSFISHWVIGSTGASTPDCTSGQWGHAPMTSWEMSLDWSFCSPLPGYDSGQGEQWLCWCRHPLMWHRTQSHQVIFQTLQAQTEKVVFEVGNSCIVLNWNLRLLYCEDQCVFPCDFCTSRWEVFTSVHRGLIQLTGVYLELLNVHSNVLLCSTKDYTSCGLRGIDHIF